mgnify:CR=1 FL=1
MKYDIDFHVLHIDLGKISLKLLEQPSSDPMEDQVKLIHSLSEIICTPACYSITVWADPADPVLVESAGGRRNLVVLPREIFSRGILTFAIRELPDA